MTSLGIDYGIIVMMITFYLRDVEEMFNDVHSHHSNAPVDQQINIVVLSSMLDRLCGHVLLLLLLCPGPTKNRTPQSAVETHLDRVHTPGNLVSRGS